MSKSITRREVRLLLLLLNHFSRVRLCDPRDGSPAGSAIPGILQARTLEWVAISFSNAWKWKVKVKSLSRVRLLATPWTAAYQTPPPMGFSRQEYWSRVLLPSLEVKLESSNTEGSGDEIVENAHKPSQWLQTFQPIGNRELLKNWQQERCHVLEIQSSRKNCWRAVEEEWSLWLALWELLIQSW